jgi:hypothetical protein
MNEIPKPLLKVEYDDCDWHVTEFNFQFFEANEHLLNRKLKNKTVGINVTHTGSYEFTFVTLPSCHIVVACSK